MHDRNLRKLKLIYIHLDPASHSVLAKEILKELQNWLRNPPPAHKMSNIKININICLSFMCNTYKNSTDSLRLTDNLIVSPDTSTVYGELCWMTWLQNQEASGWKQRLIVCVISVTHWSVSDVATRILIRTKKNLGPPIPLNAELNPICYLLALLGAHHFLHVSRIRVKSLTLRVLMSYTGCPRRKGQNFVRVFLMLKYTDITQNTYIQSWMVTEIMAREVWNFDSCYTLTDYQIHIKTGRNMWFL